MAELGPQLNLAQQFFDIANVITAFSVVQTAALLLSFSKDSRLVAALLRWRPTSSVASTFAGPGYIVAVVICGAAEFWLRYEGGQRGACLGACAIAAALRSLAIYAMSSVYLRVFVEVCREEDWLNKNQPNREFQIPRLLHRRSKHQNLLYKKAEKIDHSLFGAPLEAVIEPKDFPQ